jgi:hypothetical protein
MNLFHIPGLLLDETAADDNATRGQDFGRRYGSDSANARWLGHRAPIDPAGATACAAKAAATRCTA